MNNPFLLIWIIIAGQHSVGFTKRNRLRVSSHCHIRLHCSVACYGCITRWLKRVLSFWSPSTLLDVLLRLFTYLCSWLMLQRIAGWVLLSLSILNLKIIIHMVFTYGNWQMSAMKLFISMNLGLFSFILILTHFLLKSSIRVQVLGWICVAISVSVFAAPLNIMVSIPFSNCGLIN